MPVSIIEWFTLAGIVISIILSLLSSMGIAYLAGVKITRLETQVEGLKEDARELAQGFKTLSEFLFRRGTAEAVIQGRASMNSPIKITEEARDLYKDLAPDLRKLAQANAAISDAELAMLIERKWGEFIMKYICIPNKMTSMECLFIAVEVARGAA
jgi:hypothetical protein